MFNTPILFLIFNRPDTTQRVFNEIRKIQPKRLYVAADGPRKQVMHEFEACKETRGIIEQVDWDCDVYKLFREENIGLRKSVGGAITWFFKNEPYGIILEDDCLPDLSFFSFCEDLLVKYKDNEQIMHIGGNNFQPVSRGEGSYYYSKISHIWGWASWSRAWKYFDPEMEGFKEFLKSDKIKEIFDDNYSQKRWLSMLKKSYKPSSKSWAYPWSFSIFNQNGICITPNKNLVTNIGFGIGGTHSLNKKDKFANLQLESITKVVHPLEVEVCKEADEYTNRNNFKRSSFLQLMNKAYLKVIQKLRGQ